ncbi:MAG TPA: 2-succinyl-5-enolpyruvyl-6-hydroxy-3-cyclohexene-1-carboxylic-acid synthase [Burkholderiales bacterium]|nr:2-succinyl-5-enolpyruvyl-6-hydroxy-3-cyclohexene-1-carboxylic-acid synthase [Burkholderiales bacterium]
MAQRPPAGTGAENLLWAAHLVDALVAAGVTRVVISPGSRSTPLALAWLRHPAARSFIEVDERSAAFFALGLSRGSGEPAALVSTSGSAPAHWWPAVIEADRSATPLLLLSADRPPELQDCGANQTVDQVKLFGGAVRAFHQTGDVDCAPERVRWLRWLAQRAADQARFPLPGPVHLNIAFREPLLPEGPAPALPQAGEPGLRVSCGTLAPDPRAVEEVEAQISGGAGLIVCGPHSGGARFAPAVAQLARGLGAPIFADPLSGLRFGPHERARVLARYDAFLRGPADGLPAPEWVIRFGAAPVSKSLNQWLARLEVPQVLVAGHGAWLDPVHRATQVLHADAAATCAALVAAGLEPAPPEWFAGLEARERRAARAAEAAPPAEPLYEAEVFRALIEALPEGTRLFAGNSMVIRDLDSFSGTSPKALEILGNRGASGIDGNISTVLGLAAAGGAPVAGVIGDLALLHNLAGLHAARGLDALLVVLNNGGGGIFGYLPQAGLPEFERGWLTPANLDIGRAAALFGVEHHRAATGRELDSALAALLPARGVRLLEVVLDREASLRRHRAYWAAAVD